MSRTKYCFAYCGPELCDCMDDNDFDPTAEYEFMAVSEALKNELDIPTLLSEGWELVGGALRREKKP